MLGRIFSVPVCVLVLLLCSSAAVSSEYSDHDDPQVHWSHTGQDGRLSRLDFEYASAGYFPSWGEYSFCSYLLGVLLSATPQLGIYDRNFRALVYDVVALVC